MSSMIPAARYYPRLSEIITIDDLPDFLLFVQDGLNAIFDKIHYKNLQYSKSYRGDAAYYSLDIVTSKKIKLSLPFGMSLVLNPDFSGGDSNISAFPITLQYQWEILAFLKSFRLSNFSFSIEDFYRIGLQVFRITDDQVLAHIFNFFVEPATSSTTKYQQVADDINLYYGFSSANNNLLELPAGVEPTINSLITAIKQHPGIDKTISLLLFALYVFDSNVSATKAKLDKFYEGIVPEGIEAYIRKIIKPKARATFALSAALEFPRNILKPVYDQNGHSPFDSTTGTPLTVIPPDANGSPKAQLKFAEAVFYADTEKGLGYSLDIALTLATPVQIGNTPLILFIQNLKLDLSKRRNIAEADLDGRPADFMGVYIQEAFIGFPQFWNHNNASTAVIKGRNLLIGTGGISGFISLEGGANASSLFQLGNPTGNHFLLSLTAFSIEFKQNAIVQSAISGKMTIPGFKSGGAAANINVLVHIGHNGDFRITASDADGGYTFGVPGVFEIALRSVSIGRENSKWYIEAAGSLTITATIPHVTTDFLKAPIEIKRLRIYQDGSIEFVGGGITLPTNIRISLGPVSLAMDHISFSSHEGIYQGANRQYFCFGFSGNLNVGNGAVDVRGDGIEFHFTRDSGTLHTYLRIAGIGVDIKIPGNASKEKADVFISGYLGMRHGTNTNGDAVTAGPAYEGAVKVDLNKLKIHGKAAMSMMPKVPAWIVDMELELATPLALGATGLGIYGFRGLIGNHYVASKTHIGLSEEDSWYEYLKKPVPPGSGPGITKDKFDPSRKGFSAGLGASIATMGDDGWAFSSKVFVLLSIPEMFLIEGKANVLHKRLGINNADDPPFYAFLVIDSQSIQAGLGVNYKLPDSGDILALRGEMQMAYFFGNSSAWYINIGKDLPEEKRVQSRLFKLFDAYSYLMLSSKGIRAGAGAKFEVQKKFGPVRVGLYAFLDTKGSISFKPLQIAGAIQLGGGLYIKISRFGIELYVAAGLSAEAPKPFIIAGFIEVKIKIAIFKVRFKLEFTWVITRTVETKEVKLIDEADFISHTAADQYPFKAINMVSEEAFMLKYLRDGLVGVDPTHDNSWNQHIIPMDSFIDIEFKRPVKPYLNRYGGGISPLPQFTEYVAPQKSRMPQVKHSFIIENIELKIWNHDNGRWDAYDPWEALTAAFANAGLMADTSSFPFGYWQYNNNPGKYTSLRLLAQTPFAVSNGTPPEHFGILSQHLLCKAEPEGKTCQYWTGIEPTHTYPSETVLRDRKLLLRFSRVGGGIGFIPNVFGIQPSLKVQAGRSVEMYFTEPMAAVTLSLTAIAGVHIQYYQKEFTGELTLSGLPRYDYRLIGEVDYGWLDLLNEVTFEDGVFTISKVVIKANSCGEDIHANFLNYWSEINSRWNGDNSLLTEWQHNQIRTWLETYGRDGGNLINIALVQLCRQWNVLLDSGELSADEVNMLEYWKSTFCGNEIDYELVLDNLRAQFSTVLEDDGRYPHIYSAVYEWNEKYYDGYVASVDFDVCSAYIHEACWLTQPQRERNILLQQNDQAVITTGANTLVNAINEVLPPVWRPNAAFAIVISTRDEIDAGGATDVSDANYPHLNSFAIGFKTAGTLGFFHQTQNAWRMLEDQNKADQYKLSGLRHYIDYQRSYPNADGNILNAKPLYYENPKLAMFFTKPYVYEFFTQWERYKGNDERNYQLLSIIMDPADTSLMPVVPPEVMGWQVHRGAAAIPVDAADIETISHVFSQGDQTCTIITDTIKPPTMNAEVQRSYAIQPQKLYRAVFKAIDVTGNQDSIVHSYTFETSRYRNFTEHINSYIRKIKDVDTGQIVTKNAVFNMLVNLRGEQLEEVALRIQQILFNTMPGTDALITRYASKYDRIINGILQIAALQAATDVEFNIITDRPIPPFIVIGPPLTPIKIFGILVRSPEPFNDPKLPETEMPKTVKLTNLEHGGGRFKYIFSRDNCCLFITNDGIDMPHDRFQIDFKRAAYNGVAYTYPATVAVNIDLSRY